MADCVYIRCRKTASCMHACMHIVANNTHLLASHSYVRIDAYKNTILQRLKLRN